MEDFRELKITFENIALRNINFNKQKNRHIIFKEYVINASKNKQFEELDMVNAEVCEFGKWCESVSTEPFVQDSAWKNVIKYHDKFHSTLKDYVEKAKTTTAIESLNPLLIDLDSDINNIFNNLTIVRDKY